MIYTDTDVICCFPGIGRTTFSKDQNKEGSTFCLDLDYKGASITAFVERVKAERENADLTARAEKAEADVEDAYQRGYEEGMDEVRHQYEEDGFV